MKQAFFLCLFGFMIACPAYAEETSLKNAGFLPSNIWYSKEPFFSGEKIRIYTIIFNGSAFELTGNVEFFDNGASIGKAPFSISSGGRARDVWVEYSAKEGKHIITAGLVEVQATGADGKKRLIKIENSETGKSEKVVDFDTDADGTGNREDLDDDNDGIADVDEIKNETDPIKKDSDGNGISDGEELKIKATEAAEAQKKMSYKTGTTTLSGPLGSVTDTVTEAIPQNVKNNIAFGTEVVERFRLGQGYQFGLNKEAKEKEIDAMTVRQKSYALIPEEDKAKISGLDASLGTLEKPFAYVLLGIFALLEYVFNAGIVFYGIIIYFLYRFIKWGWHKMRY